MNKDMRYYIRRFGIIVMTAIFILSLGGCSSKSDDDPEEKRPETNESTYYDIEFHRGGRGARPENTLYSYQYALENGAVTIECDMQMTADGHIVMSHNSVLNPDITEDSEGSRIKGDKYYIRDMTLEEVQSFNVGLMDESCEYFAMHGRTQVKCKASIPTLRHLFELVRDSGNENVRLSIEAKYMPDPSAGALYEKNYDKDEMLYEFKSLVEEFGFKDRVRLQSFDWDILARMKKMDPNIMIVALYNEQESWGVADSMTLWLDRYEPSPWLGGLDIKDFGGDPVKAAAWMQPIEYSHKYIDPS